nr:citrate lyase holo-[acyl-carrier protein] synthase [uncultured Dethiosulfovibrio sp.]
MNSSLESILKAREERWELRQELVKEHQKPLLSLSMVIPGPDKNRPGALDGFIAIFRTVEESLGDRVLWVSQVYGEDGSSRHWVVDMAPRELKALSVGIEETHPLGRLADLDVLGETGEPLSRVDIGYPPRKCLLCGRSAKECGASRSHRLEDLVGEVDRILSSFTDK